MNDSVAIARPLKSFTPPLELVKSATPFFAISRDELKRRYWDFRYAFPDAGIFYAIKANPHASVLTTLADEGCGFEVASLYELDLLRPLDIDPRRVISGTAVKGSDHIASAHQYGINVFAADSRDELTRLARHAPHSGVYVRVTADDSASVFQMSRKFGAPAEDALDLLSAAADLGLQPLGVSFNIGSQSRDRDAWARSITSLSGILGDLGRAGLPAKFLNIGGGYPGAYRSASDAAPIEAIARSIYAACDLLPYKPQLLLEPGRGLVAEAAVLVTSVIARVERSGTSWLYLDAGVYNALFESLAFQGSTRYEVEAATPRTEVMSAYTLAGPTGDGLDVIDEHVELPVDLQEGDRLVFHHVGAYSMALSSAFNGFPHPVTHVV